jgi:hypothetical protein
LLLLSLVVRLLDIHYHCSSEYKAGRTTPEVATVANWLRRQLEIGSSLAMTVRA